MSKPLHLQLTDEAFRALERRAAAAGTSPSNFAATELERRLVSSRLPQTAAEAQAARERFERHFGEIDLGAPTGADNESIDRDLARAYADNHEDG